jgi:5-oxoprolinase (ATP-hydrolysing)
VTAGWRFWIDRGGTFTDIVAQAPDGALLIEKLLSENPGRYADAAVHGISELIRRHGGPGRIEEVRLGTTVATNALLERKGEPTVLAVSAGLGDVLRIGYQARPRLFDRRIELPEPLYERVIEVEERLTATGEIRRALDEEDLRRQLAAARRDGYRSIAIVLMHAYRHPVHELRAEALAREAGFEQVSTSHRVSALMKIVGRGDTTVVDAYLSPPLRRYVEGVSAALGAQTRLSFMQSNGGLAAAEQFRGRDAVLSGPAGGIVGMAQAARDAGFERVIGFDMGGTSTDVSHFAGEYERVLESTVAGVRLRTPMLHIHTVAAGGGSICRFDGARLRVGPQSAGANPGPACYRRGGPLTITDCNLMLGRLRPDTFPAVFGPRGDQTLDDGVVAERFEDLAAEVSQATGRPVGAQALAEGFLAIAVDNMAHAIKHISVARGYDLTDYALVCFGGAGGQHACLVARALGIDTILVSPLASVLSAYGIGQAEHRSLKHRTLELPLLEASDAMLARAFGDIEAELRVETGEPAKLCHRYERRVRLKYAGSDTALAIAWDAVADLRPAFEAAYRRRFAFIQPGTPVIVEAVEVEWVGSPAKPGPLSLTVGRSAGHASTAPLWSGGALTTAPVLDRASLAGGREVVGPALICDPTSTFVVDPGWRAALTDRGDLIATFDRAADPAKDGSVEMNPVKLEVFNNLFMAIAEQMGAALQGSAQSVNIKERLDFSCAIFDRHGALVANAPHMPVHLGSMGDSVRAVRQIAGADLRPGDLYALNNPYRGGTHLPDITVVMPVFSEDAAQRLQFFVAARGHHADVGGPTPGSMPPASRTIDEEGVLIDGLRIVRSGVFDEALVRSALGQGPWPARNIDQNLGDLRAQVAACVRGAGELRKAIADHGESVVMAYMQHVQDNAAAAVENLLARLGDGAFRYEADDGWAVETRVAVDRTARRARIDFTGTHAQLANNFNAPVSIARAAALYVIRTLLDDEIPMNDGCLRPIEIVTPKGSLLNPAPPAAVVAGNVETSQMVTDALYGAVGALAAAQGTMNNFTFGDEALQYYETICGGAGAGPDFDGADAVQTHMTNSRLTDPEVLEWRFPVILERFAVRQGSGGSGAHRGGDGVVRQLRFLRPMTAAILSNHRRVPPFGLAGGAPGQVGLNYVLRADGRREDLPGCAETAMGAGDAFVIETPGGGGFGPAPPDRWRTRHESN